LLEKQCKFTGNILIAKIYGKKIAFLPLFFVISAQNSRFVA